MITQDDCSILQVREVRPSDTGPVTCTARVCSPSLPPTTVTCGTHLELDGGPSCPATLLRGPCDTTAMCGDRVLLKATFRGDPPPTVRWLKAVSKTTKYISKFVMSNYVLVAYC